MVVRIEVMSISPKFTVSGKSDEYSTLPGRQRLVNATLTPYELLAVIGTNGLRDLYPNGLGIVDAYNSGVMLPSPQKRPGEAGSITLTYSSVTG